MRKRMILWAALLGAVAAMFSCQKEQVVYSLSIEATKGADGEAVKALSLNGTSLTPSWATTENVYVKKGNTWADGALHPQTNGPTATLKGTLSGVTFAARDGITLQFPRSGDITYVGQKGTLADLAANFDWATATVNVESVEGGQIIVSRAIDFQSQQAIVKFKLKKESVSGSEALYATKLDVLVDGTVYNINPGTGSLDEFYVALPGFSNKYVVLIATDSDDNTYSYSKGGVTFTNGKYYTRTVTLAPSH